MQKSYCYTPGVRVGVHVRMQNVRANVKVMKFQSLCILSCIFSTPATLVQKSYCYTPGVSVPVGVSVRVSVGVCMQNVRANVKVLKVKSFCVSLCFYNWPNILIYSLTLFLPPILDPWGLNIVLKWNVRANVKMFRFQYFCVSFYTNVT